MLDVVMWGSLLVAFALLLRAYIKAEKARQSHIDLLKLQEENTRYYRELCSLRIQTDKLFSDLEKVNTAYADIVAKYADTNRLINKLQSDLKKERAMKVVNHVGILDINN